MEHEKDPQPDIQSSRLDELELRINTHQHKVTDNTGALPDANSIFPEKVFTSGDATPSIKGSSVYDTTGTTAITDFDDGRLGQIIFIRAQSSITITHNASIINLSDASNFDMVSGDTLTLGMFEDQVWTEVARTLVTEPSTVSTDIQEFTTDGTWTKPAGALSVSVYVFGAGGGGAAGTRGVAAPTGGAGAGGAFGFKRFNADALSATEAIVVGEGGTGGAGQAADAEGNPGIVGEDSSFGTTVYILAKGGTAGDGDGTGGVAVSANGEYYQDSGAGADKNAANDGVAGASTAVNISPRGGGSGGGAGIRAGGAGGGFITHFVLAGGAGGAAGSGTGNGSPGLAGATLDLGLLIGGTGGGGGGGTSNDFTSGAGGDGGYPGGGGGSSGGKEQGTGGGATGDGGDGANGAVIVITTM